MVVAKEYVESFRSANGCGIYDDTGWEFAADQFAQKHGAGKDLVIAQNLMYRAFGSLELASTPARLTMQVLDLAGSVLYGAFSFGLVPILSFPSHDILHFVKVR